MDTNYLLMTFGVALFTLIFSKAPFGVVVYALLMQTVSNMSDWSIMTGLLLISQLGYTLWSNVKS